MSTATLIVLVGFTIPSGSSADSGGAGSHPELPVAQDSDPPTDYWQAKAEKRLAMAHRFEIQRNRLRKQLHRAWSRWRPTVEYAYKLASTIYGVSYWQLHAVGACESHHYPFATNGQYRGVFQEGPMFERGPFGRAGFSVFDPLANVLTAAYTVARQGWRQWECRP